MTILIPAYNPDSRFVALLQDLRELCQTKILIINDGSQADCDWVFNKIAYIPNCKVVNHAFNRGKGQALKTGFAFLLKHAHEFELEQTGVVAADCDGQHLPVDIVRLQETIKNNPEAVCLGVRQIGRAMPWKSWLGNSLSNVLFFCVGLFSFGRSKWLKDTQTGLRAMPSSALKALLKIEGKGFEYEFNCLLNLAFNKRGCFEEQEMPIVEIPIETVYIENNKHSHFRAVSDSLKIFCHAIKKSFSLPEPQ